MSTTTINDITDFRNTIKNSDYRIYDISNIDSNVVKTYNRKDFFKICLISGEHKIHYADKSIHFSGVHLFLGNPFVPYSWEVISKNNEGYTALFTDKFMLSKDRNSSILESSLFKIGAAPLFEINDTSKEFIANTFKRMLLDQDSNYQFKRDLIKDQINLIVHEAMKLKPSIDIKTQNSASERITAIFMELLERQFTEDSAEFGKRLKAPNEFADRLSVHINHLNRAVKEVTGKSTSVLIAERTTAEAKVLLKNSRLSISEIAFLLGFDYTTHFNNYFKKITGFTPSFFRQ